MAAGSTRNAGLRDGAAALRELREEYTRVELSDSAVLDRLGSLEFGMRARGRQIDSLQERVVFLERLVGCDTETLPRCPEVKEPDYTLLLEWVREHGVSHKSPCYSPGAMCVCGLTGALKAAGL